MTSIWLNSEYAAIRSYGAAVKGPRAVVKIEVEVSDPAYLGYFLEDLGKAQAELKRAKLKKERSKPDQPAIEQKKLLAIPFFGDRS